MIWTCNLLIWSQMRYHCATGSALPSKCSFHVVTVSDCIIHLCTHGNPICVHNAWMDACTIEFQWGLSKKCSSRPPYPPTQYKYTFGYCWHGFITHTWNILLYLLYTPSALVIKAIDAYATGFAFAGNTAGSMEMVTFPSCPIPFKWKCVPIPFNRKMGMEQGAEQATKLMV